MLGLIKNILSKLFFQWKIEFPKKKAIFSQWRSAFAGEIYFPQEQFSQNFKLLFTNSQFLVTLFIFGVLK